MKARCSNPKVDAYPYYGGKGVTVCSEWSESYSTFRDWAISAGYKRGLTIDRIDSGGNYEPSNCQLLTLTQQAQKKDGCSPITATNEPKVLIDLQLRTPQLVFINRFALREGLTFSGAISKIMEIQMAEYKSGGDDAQSKSAHPTKKVRKHISIHTKHVVHIDNLGVKLGLCRSDVARRLIDDARSKDQTI